MQIKIKKLDGQTNDLNVEENDTVLMLKERLSDKSGVPKEQIRLIYLGNNMGDNMTLKSCKVTVGAVIHMIIQLRGG